MVSTNSLFSPLRKYKWPIGDQFATGSLASTQVPHFSVAAAWIFPNTWLPRAWLCEASGKCCRCRSHKQGASSAASGLGSGLGGERLLWKFTGYAWPPGCTVTLLFKAALGRAWSWPAPFVLTCDTTGCESLPLTGGAGQDELAALGSGAEFILVPWGSTVCTFWGWKNNLCYKHTPFSSS